MLFQTSTLLTFLPALVSAIAPPNIDGFSIIWSDDFAGSAGSSPNDALWTIAQNIDTNNEIQVYTTSNQNIQISGGQTIQFVPRKAPSGQWTSGRIETKESFTPSPGKSMIIQGSIALGTNPTDLKQGIWPAFWTLGDAMRHGTDWPRCGELDIMEQVNGINTAYGTAHCGDMPGGICSEPIGRQATTEIPSDGFHTWAIKIDRTNDDWTQQCVTWTLDGQEYNRLTGAAVGDEATFATLAHSPLYILLNVAVGGNWPGSPNDATADGYGNMMEVAYVAVYSS
ncbi:beta-glucanase [Bisporella sp. PMI_857]|nr:beta-glucanase [Bisporella sp. PMI_857]